MMSAKKLAELVRMKKKKLMDEAPEVVETPPMPMNANDVDNEMNKARMEASVGSEDKKSAPGIEGESEHDAMAIGLTTKEAGRMSRLRKWMDDSGTC
jgi:hypothetical protein